MNLLIQAAQVIHFTEQAGDAFSRFLCQLGVTLHDLAHLLTGGPDLHDGLSLVLGGLDDVLGQGVGLLGLFLGRADDLAGLNGDLLAGTHDFHGVADHLRGLPGRFG